MTLGGELWPGSVNQTVRVFYRTRKWTRALWASLSCYSSRGELGLFVTIRCCVTAGFQVFDRGEGPPAALLCGCSRPQVLNPVNYFFYTCSSYHADTLDFMDLINDCLHLSVHFPSPWHFWDKPYLVLARKSLHMARHGACTFSKTFAPVSKRVVKLHWNVWSGVAVRGAVPWSDWEVWLRSISFSPISQKHV